MKYLEMQKAAAREQPIWRVKWNISFSITIMSVVHIPKL